MSGLLFTPCRMGEMTLANRVLMAPLTRMRATRPGDVPNELIQTYYQQRASAGLIISEGVPISAEAKGYEATPGVYTSAQVEHWRSVTQAVHENGGKIAAQLWHVGRISHSRLQLNGQVPVSASAIAARSRTTLLDENNQPERVNCDTPRALLGEEIPRLLMDYQLATQNARAAGFDMVEIHAAHGYLLQQFQSADCNQRKDNYGGSLGNRARLTLEVVDAVIAAWDKNHVGIRISPIGTFNGLTDAEGEAMAYYLAEQLQQRGVAYLHISEPDWVGGPALTETFRKNVRARFSGIILGAGNYTVEKAEALLAQGYIDAAVFGRSFIANPDLPKRLQEGLPLNPPRPEYFYGGGAEGYVDYPVLA